MRQHKSCVNEQGATLVVVMTFLLVISLLAVSGLETSHLESKMVANSARMEETLANAEYGLKLGEQAVREIVSDKKRLEIEDTDFFYPLEGEGAIWPSDPDWSGIPVKGTDRKHNIEYVVQYAGAAETAVEGNSSVIGPDRMINKGEAHLFIITARAWKPGTVRLVQSVYATSTPP
jgi:Tfp pilus assembly protein PilX